MTTKVDNCSFTVCKVTMSLLVYYERSYHHPSLNAFWESCMKTSREKHNLARKQASQCLSAYVSKSDRGSGGWESHL